MFQDDVSVLSILLHEAGPVRTGTRCACCMLDKASTLAHRLLECPTPGDKEDAGAASLIVMDMGMHVFHDLPEPKQLFQILVPGLEERARMLPKLSTAEQLSPGEQLCGAAHVSTHSVAVVKHAVSLITIALDGQGPRVIH